MLADLVLPGGIKAAELTRAQQSAAALALMALIVGIIVLVMSFSKRLYDAENWTAESGPEEYRKIVPQLRQSGIATIAIAAGLCALALPVDPARAVPVFAVIAVSMLVQLWLSWQLWKDGDELYRSVVLEGSALSLGLVFIILSLWAPLALYGYMAFDLVAMVVVLLVACIVPTVWLTIRRGMAE
jgi:hypothetical protein